MQDEQRLLEMIGAIHLFEMTGLTIDQTICAVAVRRLVDEREVRHERPGGMSIDLQIVSVRSQDMKIVEKPTAVEDRYTKGPKAPLPYLARQKTTAQEIIL